MDKCASIRGRCNARRGARRQGGHVGSLMQRQGGAKEREGDRICRLAWRVPAAGGVQWGDAALHRAPSSHGGGRDTVGARPKHPAGRQPGLTGPAEHPGPVGESGAATCLLCVCCCLERDSHGLLSLSVEALLWGELWSGGICRAMTSRGPGLVGIGCYSGPTWCCNPICACWYRRALHPGHQRSLSHQEI